jgi:restriction system protein
MDSIFGKQKKILESQQLYNLAIIKYEDAVTQNKLDLEHWESECIAINEFNKRTKAINEKVLRDYNTQIDEIKRQKEEAIKNWQKANDDFYTEQSNYNKKVEHTERSYRKLELNTVGEFAKLILDYSKYPDFVPKRFDIDYNSETKILVVDYALPPIDSLPTLKGYTIIKDVWRGYYISDTQLQKNFELTMYNITLRTLFELFNTDTINALESIRFNGWVNAINKATGKRENNCILSVQTKKEDFLEIDLRNVDPKACFKSLKGVSCSKLSAITSIQPIIQINKTDKRFVDSHDITGNIDNSTNLAAMDWEDFEHLIREVFEKEFQSNGGEVKVTQASRDGGVDAIAFDPDPIRGGKIVIQAKRYTNTVGVSAVRDLYGTVMNEGATKGILVTTSDYGSDSYEFAKGKPLTLLNGSNLLYLLEKHGHRAKIDIEEARKLMKENIK